MGIFSKLFGLGKTEGFLNTWIKETCISIFTIARVNESYSKILTPSELRLLSKAVTPFASPCKVLIGGKRYEGISNLSSEAEQVELKHILLKIGGRLVRDDKEITEVVIGDFCGTSHGVAVVLHWWRTHAVMWCYC
jgi:hypothetical protein